jgi:transposase
MPVYLGIDWSESKHDAVFLNVAGVEQARLTFEHSADGFLQLDQLRQRLGVAASDCWVGLETAHNIVIDFLWAKGYQQVFVIPPSMTEANRGRRTSSRAHNDYSDARLLADIVRTDQSRLRPWHPDSLLVQRMRVQLSQATYLTKQSVRLHNRLRSLLVRYYPAAVHVFSTLMQPISLNFICAYPTPQAAQALSYADFRAWARSHHHTRPDCLAEYYAQLHSPQPEAAAEVVDMYQGQAVQLARELLATLEDKQQTLRELALCFKQHPDAPIFDSLPGTGKFLAPALLAKFGDDRQRFERPASLQALAGTCPVTEASGKRHRVHFRHACDREFRHIAQQWAKASLRQSPWAVAYYNQVYARCESANQAYRCLANRWLAIAWKLWQNRQPYDETYHMQQRLARSQPKR